uniref:Uncharacterized protein n=1 Tax=Anopheles culicifacies TaxID=139723 RepID=A0A182LX04_9DIPT
MADKPDPHLLPDPTRNYPTSCLQIHRPTRTHTHMLAYQPTRTNANTFPTDIDPQVLEIQRQNLITQKILQRYLERRLHPGRKPQIRVPSVEEILPKPFSPLASVRDVRQQNQTNASSENGGSRYDLFNGRNGRQYNRTEEDGGNQDEQYNDEETGGEDYREERDLDQYDDLGESFDNDRYDIESLQSGESEHVDSFYRDKYYSRQRGNYPADPIQSISTNRPPNDPTSLSFKCLPLCATGSNPNSF